MGPVRRSLPLSLFSPFLYRLDRGDHRGNVAAFLKASFYRGLDTRSWFRFAQKQSQSVTPLVYHTVQDTRIPLVAKGPSAPTFFSTRRRRRDRTLLLPRQHLLCSHTRTASSCCSLIFPPFFLIPTYLQDPPSVLRLLFASRRFSFLPCTRTVAPAAPPC